MTEVLKQREAEYAGKLHEVKVDMRDLVKMELENQLIKQFQCKD